MDILFKYFPDLSEEQIDAFRKLGPLVSEWNDKINLISRKDIENLYLHHILHCLAIAKYLEFAPDSQILDLGTGGGFPGIPLAILFPQTHFTLIDARAKKIKVVKALADELDLKNVFGVHARAEEFKGQYDFVVSRAVAPLNQLKKWSDHLILKPQYHSIPNGLICLKGGELLKEEIKALPQGSYVEKTPIDQWFKEDYFQNKYVVYLQA